jgi:hypothetical protein
MSERFDLENELRAGRSQPRSEFVSSLASDVRGRVRRTRVGMTLALTGLVIVAVASFGGIGTAATSKSNTPAKSATAASAQYKTFIPKTAKKQSAGANEAAQAKATPKPAATAPSTQLPFTGLALWVPLAVGLVLIALGVAVRTRAKRHGAH